MTFRRGGWRTGAIALVSMAMAATACADESVWPWTLSRPPKGGDGSCTLRQGDHLANLSVVERAGEVGIDVSVFAWSVRDGIRYPVRLTIDRGEPVGIEAVGAEPHTLRLAPNPSLPGARLVALLSAGASLTVGKPDEPLRKSATFTLGDVASALAKLRACRDGPAPGSPEAAARERCDRLAEAVTRQVGGTREDDVIVHPEASILLVCRSDEPKPRLTLTRDEPGFPPAMLRLAEGAAAALTGQPASRYAGLGTRCLKAVTTLARGRGHGRRMGGSWQTSSSGTVSGPGLTVTCQYKDARTEPTIYLEPR